MENISLKIDKIYDFVSKDAVAAFKTKAEESNAKLHNKSCKGNDFLGWLHLPSTITKAELSDLDASAKVLASKSEIVVVVGIGGSYLGAKCVIDGLSNNFPHLMQEKGKPVVLFAGQNLCEDYTADLLALLDKKEYSIIVISKSGTTTEPAVAFRLLKQHIEKKYGKADAKDRIVAITDASKGALRKLATQEGYKTFIIPDDVGGRFSVLTPVGLLPIAAAGFDITKLVEGAISMEKATGVDVPFELNISAQYAAARNALLQTGKITEILVNYSPRLHYFAEWWKQLYGESEGKENKGIFPASVDFTSDLHSMGQYIQEGSRHIFETVLSIKAPKGNVKVPVDADNLDSLNFIAGKRVDEVNKMAELGTLLAHVDGGVPNMMIEVPQMNEFYVGQLIYFFEKACGISGSLLEVNPYDQPGVEAYKNNMFALLGKPGYEEQTKKIQEKIK
jgi:glucose-6-phosphate isomerase